MYFRLVDIYVLLFFFFFKQKTAYEMRISDWSSDVCSSDLEVNQVFFDDVKVPKENLVGEWNQGWTCAKYLLEFERGNAYSGSLKRNQIGRASCRERVCQYV